VIVWSSGRARVKGGGGGTWHGRDRLWGFGIRVLFSLSCASMFESTDLVCEVLPPDELLDGVLHRHIGGVVCVCVAGRLIS
jgi:hypothetical protein